MFFKISSARDRHFPVQYALPGGFWLNVDTGWTELDSVHGTVYWKGYCYQFPIGRTLADHLFNHSYPNLAGNFVAILACSDGTIRITNDDCRATPLWTNNSEIGNISVDGNPVWSDSICTIKNKEVTQDRYDAIGDVTSTTFGMNDALDSIHNILIKKFQWLKKQRRPVKIFYSGGIDTLTCLAYLRHLDIGHELITGEHYDYDKFTTEFSNELLQYWGYRQIHHWRESCYLVSGAPGDEYFMRGPSECNFMLMHMGLTVEDILQPSDYHYDYFQGLEKSKIYEQQRNDPELKSMIHDRQLVCRQIVNMALNDHQHWHLGNTLTFTPFRDTQILKIVLQLDNDELIRNMANATVQKALIERTDPELLQFLPPLKNQSRTPIYHLWARLYR